MITVNQTGVSEFVLNLIRNNVYFAFPTGSTECYYGVVVKSRDNNKTKSFLITDTSIVPRAYNQFSITGTTSTESLNLGVVNLSPPGLWDYTIYPSTGSTINDINLICPLEYGLLKVIKN